MKHGRAEAHTQPQQRCRAARALAVGNSLFLGYRSGAFSLNATTGALLWTTTVGPGVISSPAISGPTGNKVLFVGDLAGNVGAFRLTDGASVFSYPAGGMIFASAGISTGQFFITSNNGFLYAFSR